jgi:hypothetical protein
MIHVLAIREKNPRSVVIKDNMTNEKDNLDRDGVITELLLRISTLEKLLIDKKVFTAKEFSNIFEASVKKVTEMMDEKSNSTKFAENNKIFVPGKLKN